MTAALACADVRPPTSTDPYGPSFIRPSELTTLRPRSPRCEKLGLGRTDHSRTLWGRITVVVEAADGAVEPGPACARGKRPPSGQVIGQAGSPAQTPSTNTS